MGKRQISGVVFRLGRGSPCRNTYRWWGINGLPEAATLCRHGLQALHLLAKRLVVGRPKNSRFIESRSNSSLTALCLAGEPARFVGGAKDRGGFVDALLLL